MPPPTQLAAHDVRQENSVVAGIEVAHRLALQMTERFFQDRHASRAVRNFESVESGFARLEPLAEVFHDFCLRLAKHIQYKRLAFGQPVADKSPKLHGDADHRRIKASLHHPARKHARGARPGAHREDEDAAGDAAEHRIEGFGFAHLRAVQAAWTGR
jgi:hypothetical protein